MKEVDTSINLPIKIFIGTLMPKMTGVPEVTGALQDAKTHAGETQRIFHSYVAVIERMAGLSDDELIKIRQALHRLERKRNDTTRDSASNINVTDILASLGNDRHVLIEEAGQAINPESKFAAAAMNQLSTRMKGGSEMRARQETPKDGDPASDAVIWGHTQITDTEAHIHFIFSHYLERYFSQVLAATGVAYASTAKDYFLNAMADVIMLDHYGRNDFADIFRVWSMPRALGYLGWLKPDRITAFAEES